MHTPSSVIASIFGLSAFAVAVLSGLLAGAEATSTLVRAFPAMLVFYVVGAVVGSKIEAMAAGVKERGSGVGGGVGGGAGGVGGNPVENSGKGSDLAG